jgi:hypothetical protein
LCEVFRVVSQAFVVAVSIAMLVGCTVSDDAPTGPSAFANTSAPLPSLTGTWTGTYRIVECVQHNGGPLANICASLGASYPFTLELEQRGLVVTGRYALANVWFDLSSSEITADRATLRGAGRIDSSGVFVDVTWSLSVAHPALGGTAVQEWAADAGGGATLRANVVGQAVQQ